MLTIVQEPGGFVLGDGAFVDYLSPEPTGLTVKTPSGGNSFIP